VKFHVHTIADELHALGFKQFSLEIGHWISQQDSPTSSKNPVPGNSASARTGRHGVARYARASAHAYKARQLSISHYAPARDEFHLPIDRLPGISGRLAL
jgi:hypothetical protein